MSACLKPKLLALRSVCLGNEDEKYYISREKALSQVRGQPGKPSAGKVEEIKSSRSPSYTTQERTALSPTPHLSHQVTITFPEYSGYLSIHILFKGISKSE